MSTGKFVEGMKKFFLICSRSNSLCRFGQLDNVVEQTHLHNASAHELRCTLFTESWVSDHKVVRLVPIQFKIPP